MRWRPSHAWHERVKTVTVISGMGPMNLPRGSARHGPATEDHARGRLAIRAAVARRGFQRAAERFRADPENLLDRLIMTWSLADQIVFKRKIVYDLFMQDLHHVFTLGAGPITLAHELALYRNYGVSLRDLPRDKMITLWHGLSDNIVPPAMACADGLVAAVLRGTPGSRRAFRGRRHCRSDHCPAQAIARRAARNASPTTRSPIP